MAKLLAILCLTAAVMMASYAVPSSSYSRGGICPAEYIGKVNTLNCFRANGVQVLVNAEKVTCNMQCTNNSSCYKITVIQINNNTGRGGGDSGTYFDCCTAKDSSVTNCGTQDCSAIGTADSNATAMCCTSC